MGNRKEKLLFARLRGMRTKTYTCGENEKEKELEGLELKKIGVCASGEGSERERGELEVLMWPFVVFMWLWRCSLLLSVLMAVQPGCN